MVVPLKETDTPTGVGSLGATSISFTGGDTSHNTSYQPKAAGTSVIGFGTLPAGYSVASSYASTTFTVTAPDTQVVVCGSFFDKSGTATIGYNMQCGSTPYLAAPAPTGGRAVTLTSSDTSKLLLSTSPTTAGTGSEVGRAGVVTDATLHAKKVIFHPLMMPRIAICDPELTIGMPPVVTAGTGMDALAHCLEAYCGPNYHPLADGIALEGIRLVKENLARAYCSGVDLEARAHMMAAAAMGASAFQKGLGAVHALSHPVGALYDTHHGMTNAVVLPYVLAFNRPAIERRIARLAAYLGLQATFAAFLAWVLELRREVGVPHTLREFGIDEDKIEAMSAMAPKDQTAAGNPVPIDVAVCRQLYRNALTGELGL